MTSEHLEHANELLNDKNVWKSLLYKKNFNLLMNRTQQPSRIYAKNSLKIVARLS